MSWSPPTARERAEYLIVFGDLTRYTQMARATPDDRIADLVDTHYEQVGRHVATGGGHLVKFIGDAFLAVFPRESADRGVVALLALKSETDEWLASQRLESRLVVKAHLGEVVAGPFGIEGRKVFDVLGSNVNTAATLPSRDFAISVEAFRALSPETRRRFKKHTPPVTYIPLESARPG